MKKSFFVLVLVSLAFMVGCCKNGNDPNDDTRESDKRAMMAIIDRDAFFTGVKLAIKDEKQMSVFDLDFLQIVYAESTSNALYQLAIKHNVLFGSKAATMSVSGNTITIQDDGRQTKLRFNSDSITPSIEITENGELIFLFESTKTDRGFYAYQLVSFDEVKNSFTIYQTYFKDFEGSLCVQEGANNRPASIYNLGALPSDFAKTGTRVHNVKNLVYSFTAADNS